MPRVSEEHLERRRQQILSAARACFARKGFHETSMQDVFREAELSAGAVYRYFRSKDELIQAIAFEVMGQLGGLMDEVIAKPPLPPIEEVVAAFADRITKIYPNQIQFQLALQAWAAAVHDPALVERVPVLMSTIRGGWISYAKRMREVGRLSPDADVEAVGKTLFGILPGFILQRALIGDIDQETLRRGVRALTTPPTGAALPP